MSKVEQGTEPMADALFTHCRDLLCTLTSDGSFSRVSDSCARITGFPARVLIGQPLLSFLHPLDRDVAERVFARVFERGHADDVRLRIRTAAGAHVPLRWTAVRDAEAEEVYLIAREMKYERERTSRRRARSAIKAAAAERARLRADLHDGLLQSLTGASLKLTSAIRLLGGDLPAARQLLESVVSLLYDEQRELRFLVEEMKQGWVERKAAAPPGLNERLADFARRLHAAWDIELLSFVTGPGHPPERLVRPLLGIVHEAVVNAARHGKATAATVQIELMAEEARLRISDNGHGLSFSGRLEDAELRARDQGPAVLKHRVWSLGGTLAIESHRKGVVVAIRIPFEDDP